MKIYCIIGHDIEIFSIDMDGFSMQVILHFKVLTIFGGKGFNLFKQGKLLFHFHQDTLPVSRASMPKGMPAIDKIRSDIAIQQK